MLASSHNAFDIIVVHFQKAYIVQETPARACSQVCACVYCVLMLGFFVDHHLVVVRHCQWGAWEYIEQDRTGRHLLNIAATTPPLL